MTAPDARAKLREARWRVQAYVNMQRNGLKPPPPSPDDLAELLANQVGVDSRQSAICEHDIRWRHPCDECDSAAPPASYDPLAAAPMPPAADETAG